MSLHSSPPRSDTDYSNIQGPYELYISRAMLGAFIVLCLVIFFILMLHVYAKWFFQRSSRSNTIRGPISRRIPFVSPPIPLSVAASAHINTGLDTASIAQLPTFVYKAASYLEAGKLDESVAQPSLECAVCLSEFQENEKGRMLPSCKHTFHTECIDMWLFSHSTCPLCRTNVVPAMATSPNTSSTHEQRHDGEEQGDIECLSGTRDSNPVVSNAVENGLFWGNETQAVSSQEPSSSSLPLTRPLHMSGASALHQITVDIPLIEGNSLVSVSGALSEKCTTEQEACSSQPVKSPGLRASIGRMLSRQSSRHKSISQEGYEGSPK